MDKYAQLAELLKGLYQRPTVLMTVQVASVEGMTCTVDVDGLLVDNVFLRPTMIGGNMLLPTPKKDSYVLVGSLSGDLKQLVVLSADELEKIEILGEKLSLLVDIEQGIISIESGDNERLTIDTANGTTTFNGGELGGLVILQKLVDNLNSIKSYVEAIHNALPSAFTAIGAGTAASGPNGATSYTGSMSGKLINLVDMENTKIKQ